MEENQFGACNTEIDCVYPYESLTFRGIVKAHENKRERERERERERVRE